jgi:hypothetical protein
MGPSGSRKRLEIHSIAQRYDSQSTYESVEYMMHTDALDSSSIMMPDTTAIASLSDDPSSLSKISSLLTKISSISKVVNYFYSTISSPITEIDP